jgi:uncharacterized RDD family membrane protein YckC
MILLAKTRLSGAQAFYAVTGFWVNACLPIFIFGVAPLSLVIWIWRRRQRTVPKRAFGGPISCQSPKFVTIWTALAMTVALVYLAFFCWISSLSSPMHFPKPRSVSTSEVQTLIANSQVRKFRFRLFQSARGARTLSGDLLENAKMTPFVAPAEDSTMALLAEKGIGYETNNENQDSPRFHMTLAGWWSERLLNPFCCFILVAGAVTLLRGSHNHQSGPHSITDLRNERRVDKAFAALARAEWSPWPFSGGQRRTGRFAPSSATRSRPSSLNTRMLDSKYLSIWMAPENCGSPTIAHLTSSPPRTNPPWKS